jgi:hypothetical protein
MRKVLLILFLALPAWVFAQSCGLKAYNPLTGNFDCIGASSGPNSTNFSAGAVTSLTVNTSSLNLANLNAIVTGCWTGTTTLTPFATYTIDAASTTSSVIFDFASTANIRCTVNATGGTGAAGTTGPAGPAPPGTGFVKVVAGTAGVSTMTDDGTTVNTPEVINVGPVLSGFNAFDQSTVSAANVATLFKLQNHATRWAPVASLNECATTPNIWCVGAYFQTTATPGAGQTVTNHFGVFGESDTFGTSTGLVTNAGTHSGVVEVHTGHVNNIYGYTHSILLDAPAQADYVFDFAPQAHTLLGTVNTRNGGILLPNYRSGDFAIDTGVGRVHHLDKFTLGSGFSFGAATPNNAFCMQAGGTGVLCADQLSDANTYSGFTFNNTALATTNYNIAGNGTDLRLNSPAGAIILAYNNAARLTVATGGLTLAATKWDASAATHSLPIPVFASLGALPVTGCTPGELAINTAATLGQQLYENSGSGTCTWTQQLNSGAGGGDTITSPNSTLNVGGTSTNTTLDAKTTLIAQKFFGTTAPGSVAGNLPGDTFNDTTGHNVYTCNAPSGTAAPACTSVTAGGWTLTNGAGGGGTSAGSNGAVQTANGLGGFLDSGCTATGGAMTCSAGFTSTGPYSATGATTTLPAAPAVGSITEWFDTTANVALWEDSTHAVIATSVVPKASRDANKFVTNITPAGVQTTAAIVNADLPTSGVTAGSYTNANVTINAQGVVTAASNGTGGTNTHQYGGQFGSVGGSALTTTNQTTYFVVPQACTIIGWNILADAGTATVKFWKIATGTAIPTVANSINTSGVALSTGTAIHSSTLTDFTTTAVSANDIGAVTLTAVSGAAFVYATFTCQ